MSLKNTVYKFLEKQPILMNIFLKKYNKYSINKNNVNLCGLQIRYNQIFLSGQNNSVVAGKMCSIKKNIIRVDGKNNIINIGNRVEMIGSSNQTIFVKGDHNHITIESDCKIYSTSFFISGNNNKIHISKKCSTIFVEFHIEQDNNIIEVGRGTTMHGRGPRTVHIALDEGTKVIIGEDCMFSNDIQIRTTDSHSIVDLNRKRINYAKDIKIGNHCWIGMGSMLMKGVELSNNTVVAAGSICTKQYDKNNIILAGNPAKIIKEDINWDRQFII